MKTPKPKLRAGIVYSGDNGRLICLHCAGMSALFSGYDLSGHAVTPQTQAEADDWKRVFGQDMTCEAGCTKHLATAGVEYSEAHAVAMFGAEFVTGQAPLEAKPYEGRSPSYADKLKELGWGA